MASMSQVTDRMAGGQRQQASVALDAIDWRILELLNADGRISVREIAQQLAIGRATAHTRLRRLVDEGVIRRFSVVVDPRRVGAGLAAYVMIKIDQHGWRALREFVAELPGVEHVALVSGDFDLIVLVRVHDPSDLRDVVLERLHAIDGVTSTRTTFVLDELDGVGLFPAGTAGSEPHRGAAR